MTSQGPTSAVGAERCTEKQSDSDPGGEEHVRQRRDDRPGQGTRRVYDRLDQRD